MRTTLKVFRIIRKLSQQDMAAKLGYGHAYYGHVERGAQNGSAEFWGRLQQAFDLSDKELQELKEIDD